MESVSDEFLLACATIAATLIGLLLLGGFFYVETGLPRATDVAPQGGPFLRAAIKLTLLLYALVLGVSLGLVVLRPGFVVGVYALLGVAVFVTMVEWSLRYRELRSVMPVPRSTPWFAWPMILVTLAVPFASGGWIPDREAMTWMLLLAGALALMSTASMLLTSFDLASWDEDTRGGSS